MLVRDILMAKKSGGATERKVIFLPPESNALAAAQVLGDKNIGLVVVSDNDSDMLGVLSERDIIHALAKHGESALGMKVEELMTRDVQTCRMRDDLLDVISTMSEMRFRHMPVVENGELKGLVSSTDIFKYFLDRGNSDELALLWAKISWT